MRTLLVLALAIAPGCRFLGSDTNDEYRPLEFTSLAVPAEIGPADTPRAEVSFLVGPNACWDLEGVRIRIEGSVLHVEGSARNPNPDDHCAQVIVYGTRSVAIPPLAAGEYVVRAGNVYQNITVTTSPTGAKDRFVYLGTVQPDAAGCDLTGHSRLQVAFSGLPDTLGPAPYLIRGEITGADPCLFADTGAVIDYFVTVDEVLPGPSD